MYEKLFYIVHNLYHNFNTVPVLKEEKKKTYIYYVRLKHHPMRKEI